ncbi:MAG: neutral/alkaline non-lysosomal ceramidase N-terminal domain-containing protein [Bacteroidales bacterium]|nr:neutral/alkaline non-lysosomal ceramidase N-terminal domain-containing protein [Bacteroidales bacterium]
MGRLLFNYGLVDITPEEPVLLGGYANRSGLSREIHRRLTSRCVVLKQAEKILCLIINDLMDVDPAIIDSIKVRISKGSAIDTVSILISSIHTHSAPETEYGRYEANDRYIDFAVKIISENACNIIGNKEGFEEAGLKYGRSFCDINIARRDIIPDDGGMSYRIGDPDGLTDKEVSILQLADDAGIKKVTLFSYACHPVILGYESNFVSTDFPGRAREVVEEAHGGMAVFMNGAAGDLNPRLTDQTDPSAVDREGELLGNAVVSAAMTDYTGTPELKIAAKTVSVPFRDQEITKEHITREAERKASDITEFFTWNEMLERWKKKVFEMIDRNEIRTSFTFKINAAKLGNTIIFCTQGEMFVRYQIELKRRFTEYHILCVAYVHGIGAYIPTAEAFEKKSYEADQAYIYEVMPSPLSPAIEQIYLDEAVGMIYELINTKL